MFEIDSIFKTFHGRAILQDVYMRCKHGEVVGLLGRNGSGKSTIFKIAFGLLSSENSFIRINGKVLRKQSDRAGRLSYLPQESFLPGKIKVKNLIPLFCNSAETNILENHPLLRPFLELKPETLSVGEQRIIEVLLIVLSDAPFAILDEPFHSLSPKVVSEIKNIIDGKKGEKGFIISDHLYRDVMEISDRLYLLSGGSVKQISEVSLLKFYGHLR